MKLCKIIKIVTLIKSGYYIANGFINKPQIEEFMTTQ